jgi:hypothetical protein
VKAARLWGAACVVLLGLYLAFPDKVFVFDGIMFSGVIERGVDEWRRELVNRRHLLFNPCLMGIRDVLALCGLKVGGYELIQRVNAVIGVLGVGVFWLLLGSVAKDRAVRALGAAALALSFGFWSRASEGQVYMMMTLWALAAGAAGLELAERPSERAAALACGAAAGGILFHAADAALIPFLILCFAAAWKRAGRPVGARWAAAGALAAVLPYALAAGMQGASLFDFASEAADFRASASGGTWSGLLGHFFGSVSRVSPAALLDSAGRSLFASSGAATGALLFAAAAACAWLAARRPAQRALVVLLAVWGGAFVALDAFWHGGEFFWCVPCAAGIAFLAAAADGVKGTTRLGMAAAVAALGGWNLIAGVLPNSRLENNLGYKRTMFVRDHTVAQSWIILSGLGYPNAKVYIPYFAHRTRDVLEYYLDRYPRDEALAYFAKFVRGNIEAGVPLYLLPDMVDDAAVSKGLLDNWGVTLARAQECFGPGRVAEIARQDPAFSVYLFIPRERADRLFAALTYGVLGESDTTRLNETLVALREIASGLSPAARAGLPGLLRESDYGAAFLEKGFWDYMGEDSRQVALERRRRFDAWQKTPAFHLRLGNVFHLLGLFGDARREWTAAYEASRDPELLHRIKALPR